MSSSGVLEFYDYTRLLLLPRVPHDKPSALSSKSLACANTIDPALEGDRKLGSASMADAMRFRVQMDKGQTRDPPAIDHHLHFVICGRPIQVLTNVHTRSRASTASTLSARYWVF